MNVIRITRAVFNFADGKDCIVLDVGKPWSALGKKPVAKIAQRPDDTFWVYPEGSNGCVGDTFMEVKPPSYIIKCTWESQGGTQRTVKAGRAE